MRRVRLRLPWVMMEMVAPFANQKVLAQTIIPAEARPGPVPEEAYHANRQGRVAACADVVAVSTHLRKPAVLLSRRTRTPMKGHWWVQGGTISCYTPVDCFLQWAFLRECGLLPRSLAKFTDFKFARMLRRRKVPKALHTVVRAFAVPCLLGVYRVPLNELPDAFAPVGLGIIKKSLVPKIGHDKDHDQIRWATERDIRRDTKLHAYVRHIVLRAFEVYREYFA